ITSGWNDAALAYCFYRGLPARIKSEFARPGKPTTLLQMKQLAQDINFFYWELQDELRQEGRSVCLLNQPSTNPPPVVKWYMDGLYPIFPFCLLVEYLTPYSKFLGLDGRLLPEEKERQHKNGLCLVCGASGHTSFECPSARS
ncbi:hypothetical protein BDV98DRAFT_488202, partial [Pterulicium gracile]